MQFREILQGIITFKFKYFGDLKGLALVSLYQKSLPIPEHN